MVVVGQTALIVEASLVVAHGLARVVLLGPCDCLLAVFIQCGSRETQRILGFRLIKAVEQQCQGRGIIDIPVQPQVGYVAPGLAVVAIAIGFQPRDVGVDAQIAMLSAILQARTPKAIAADRAAAIQRRMQRCRSAVGLNDAARGIAVECAQWAA